MPYYIYAWMGAFISGLFVVTAKLTSKYSIANPWLFNFVLIIATLLFMIPTAILNQAGLPTNWWLIFLTAVFATLFNLTWILATYLLDVSVLSPLFNFRGVFVVILGYLFLNEKFSLLQLGYIVIILLGGIIATLDEKLNYRTFFTKSIALGILSSLFLAIYNALLKPTIAVNGLWTTNLWLTISNAILLIPTWTKFNKDLKAINLSHLMPVGVLGIFNVITEIAANAAYASNVVVTSLIMNIPFSMIIAFCLSIFAPQLLEKHTYKIYALRFASAAVMIFCAVQLSQ